MMKHLKVRCNHSIGTVYQIEISFCSSVVFFAVEMSEESKTCKFDQNLSNDELLEFQLSSLDFDKFKEIEPVSNRHCLTFYILFFCFSISVCQLLLQDRKYALVEEGEDEKVTIYRLELVKMEGSENLRPSRISIVNCDKSNIIVIVINF